MANLLEVIPGDTDEGNPAVTSCFICGKVCQPKYRELVGSFAGSPTYDYLCEKCDDGVVELITRLEGKLHRIPSEEIVFVFSSRTHTTVEFTNGRYSCSCPNIYNRIYPFRMKPINREIEPQNGTNGTSSWNLST